MLWLAGDVKEPTRLSERVGHAVPGKMAMRNPEGEMHVHAKGGTTA